MSNYYQVYQNGMPKNIWLCHQQKNDNVSIDILLKIEISNNQTSISDTSLNSSEFRTTLNGIPTNGKSLESIKKKDFDLFFNQALQELQGTKQKIL